VLSNDEFKFKIIFIKYYCLYMENEVNQEYFSSKRNKVSLAMWVLINNNVVSSNIFVLMILVEFVFNLIITLGLYN